ncbi:MAG: hypothetical protein LBQ15_03515 [Clostridium sp.]|jgi:hypothetical protein|nr:hypothetical protein [Clostridium sp.]
MNDFNDRYLAVCENHDWTVIDDDDATVELSKYSPAGEDFSFTADKKGFVESVKQYAAGFNIDEHIEMWIEARKNGVRGVPSTRELVKDAEDIDKMLRELAAAVWREEENQCKMNKITFTGSGGVRIEQDKQADNSVSIIA